MDTFLTDGTTVVILITALSNLSDRVVKLIKAHIPALYLPDEVETDSERAKRKSSVEWLALIVPLVVSVAVVAFLNMGAGFITDEMAVMVVAGTVPASTAWFTLESYRKSKKVLAKASIFNGLALTGTLEETEEFQLEKTKE